MLFGIDLNYAIVVLFSILLTLTGVAIYNQFKSSKEFTIELVTPILIEAITEAEKIYKASVVGEDAIIEYVCNYITEQINESDRFTEQEKAFLTQDRIKTIVQPVVDRLWDKKL